MKMKLTILSFLFINLCMSTSVEARHILGGSMSHTHTADNIYQIRLNLYSDCGSTPSFFDDPAIITIYKGDAFPFEQTFTVMVNLNNSASFSVVQDDCVVDPYAFCLDKADYVFEFDLPEPEETYHFVYQRCCYGPNFSNIVSPEETGITLTTVIKGIGSQINNSSPQLSDNLFFEVCNGENFDFDLSAIDANADSLVYELCSPLVGGGPFGTAENPGDPNACEGVMPNPACSPPFASITYNTPTYNFEQPLGVNASIQLDRNTGQISGTPDVLGQFMAGICIKEYINGEVVSTSQQNLVLWVDFALDAQEVKPLALSVYPNPTTEVIYISLPFENHNFDLLLRDINGAIVRKVSGISGQNFELPVSGIQGLYFVELRTAEQVYFGKVMVL